MVRKIDKRSLETYNNRVDLYELDGELNGYDYTASGEVESQEDIEELAELSEIDIQEEEETYIGIEVQVLFTDEHYDRVGETLF
jgi:hypothetical protein